MPRTTLTALALTLLMPVASQAMMAGALPDSPANRIDPIVEGSNWSGVVAIKVGTGVFSGVLIADRYVLTARHVVGDSATTPSNLSVVINLPGGATTHVASRVDLFPNNNYPYDDLALIQLGSDAPSAAKRYAVQDHPITISTTQISLVGYGSSGQGDVGTSIGSNASIRRVGDNVVDYLTPKVDNSGRTSSFYMYDFDGPTGNGPMGGPTLGNARETMVASGDSGSPAFTLHEGQQVVMGINTFASSLSSSPNTTYTFGQGGGGILLSDPRFITWLRERSDNEIHLASEIGKLPLVPLSLMTGAGVLGGLVLMRIRRARRA